MTPFQIELDIEVWVAILLVDSTTFFRNLVNFELANPCGFFVGCYSILTPDYTSGGSFSSFLGVDIRRKNSSCYNKSMKISLLLRSIREYIWLSMTTFSRCFRVEFRPKLVNKVLRG